MTIQSSPNPDPAPAPRCGNRPPYRETVPGEAFYLRRIPRADPNHLFAHMGYLIGEKDYWRSNAAIEATSLICDFAFFDRGLRKILEATTENHIASNFNFRRLGFTFEGKIPDLYWGDGKYQAATYWSMNATTWAEKRGRTAEEVTP